MAINSEYRAASSGLNETTTTGHEKSKFTINVGLTIAAVVGLAVLGVRSGKALPLCIGAFGCGALAVSAIFRQKAQPPEPKRVRFEENLATICESLPEAHKEEEAQPDASFLGIQNKNLYYRAILKQSPETGKFIIQRKANGFLVIDKETRIPFRDPNNEGSPLIVLEDYDNLPRGPGRLTKDKANQKFNTFYPE